MEIVDYSNVMQESINILEECLKKYQLSELFLSFNGGKDCTVLLDLTLSVINKLFPNDEKVQTLQIYYIQSDNPFPELESFIHDVKNKYNLNMIHVPGNIKEALRKILTDNSNLRACLMGTRQTDPYCENLGIFEMTDKDWPQVMRISPLLNWSYNQIWSYLLEKNVPYCKLYDQGYTSIGNIKNTRPNPSLKISIDGQSAYNPAYMLKDGALERQGRNQIITNGKL